MLSAQTSTDPAFLRCLAGMSDVYDWLALRLDRSGTPSDRAFDNSVRATVLSMTVLRHRSWTVSELEVQELKITSRHRHLSWYASTLQASPSDERYPELLPYLVFRYGLYERMFAEPSLTPDAVRSRPPGEVSNRLWSANWRALSLSRTALHNFLSALRAGTSKVSSHMTAARMGEILAINSARAVSDNIAAIHEHMAGLRALRGPGFRPPGGSSLMQRAKQLAEEVEKAKEIFTMFMAAQSNMAGGSYLVRLTASEQVSAMLSEIASLSNDNLDWMVARSIESDF